MFREATISVPLEDPSVLGLTERQKMILERIVKGNSYKMIAEDLFITVDTVKFHVKNIYDALQIRSRHELSARFKA
jgi:DNA-binding NarL/FixJ family response regulator